MTQTSPVQRNQTTRINTPVVIHGASAMPALKAQTIEPFVRLSAEGLEVQAPALLEIARVSALLSEREGAMGPVLARITWAVTQSVIERHMSVGQAMEDAERAESASEWINLPATLKAEGSGESVLLLMRAAELACAFALIRRWTGRMQYQHPAIQRLAQLVMCGIRPVSALNQVRTELGQAACQEICI